MSRSVNDPRVVAILAAIDRAIASPHDLANHYGSAIITQNYSGERLEGWPADSVRAIVLAYALLAPEDELDGMAQVARDRHVHVDWWDRAGHIRSDDGMPDDWQIEAC